MNRQFFILIALVLSIVTANAQSVDETTVEALVKAAPCMDQTVEAMLTGKIKTGSQRDLGWQVFKEDDHFEVERAFLVSKSMQLRFRWRVNGDGSITAVSKRAEALCVLE